MKNRHQSRIVALQILYAIDLKKDLKDFSIDQDMNLFFENFEVSFEVQNFTKALVEGTMNQLDFCDHQIKSQSKNWKLDRMGYIDRSILRMAIFELKQGDTPKAVIIDEAIELAKEYGDEDSPAFVNGILDSLSKKID